MEDNEILNLWKAQEAQLQRSLAVNNRMIQEIQTQKVQSVLQGITRTKIIAIGAFFGWIVILANILFVAINNYSPATLSFIISIACIMLVNIKGMADHIRHIVMINSIQYDRPVTDMQQRLSQLQASFIKNVRVMFWQFPFFSTWHLHLTLFGDAGWWGWLLQLSFTGLFVYIPWSVHKNLRPANSGKKWFRSLVEGSGARSVAKAMAFYDELEAFRG